MTTDARLKEIEEGTGVAAELAQAILERARKPESAEAAGRVVNNQRTGDGWLRCHNNAPHQSHLVPGFGAPGYVCPGVRQADGSRPGAVTEAQEPVCRACGATGLHVCIPPTVVGPKKREMLARIDELEREVAMLRARARDAASDVAGAFEQRDRIAVQLEAANENVRKLERLSGMSAAERANLSHIWSDKRGDLKTDGENDGAMWSRPDGIGAVLSFYEASNLLSLLTSIGVPGGLCYLASGDWAGQLRWKLAFLEDPEHWPQPNATPGLNEERVREGYKRQFARERMDALRGERNRIIDGIAKIGDHGEHA